MTPKKHFSLIHHPTFRGAALTVAAALLLQAVLPTAVSAAEIAVEASYGPKIDYISEDNAPTLYGTSEITVPAGTKIDYEHDARFRVFARDNEDEDLTNQIKAEADFKNGTAPEAGKDHYIKYSVEDSDGNITRLEVPVHVTNGENTKITLKKLMYTLPSVSHLNQVGQTRGHNHDRQMMGVFVDAGGSLEMRKLSGPDGVGLTVSLYNNDNKAEPTADYLKSVTEQTKASSGSEVDESGWIKITNDFSEEKLKAYNDTRTSRKQQTLEEQQYKERLVFTPFVKTLYYEGTIPPTVEYEIRYDTTDELVKPLHYYHQGDGVEYEKQFKKEWKEDSDESAYAVVDGWSLMILVPPSDKDLMTGNKVAPGTNTTIKQFDTLDEWAAYWNSFTNAFDELAGLSYEPQYWWDQNIKTKFFAKADASGAGAAFYGGDYIGVNNTVDWTLFNVSWGNLHEVGHGYQGSPGKFNTESVYLTEVTVNIYSYYANAVRWDDLYGWSQRDDWLKKAANESTHTGKKDNDYIGMRGRALGDNLNEYEHNVIGAKAFLYMFVNLLDYFNGLEPDENGPGNGYADAYAAINQLWRKTYYTEGKTLDIFDCWALALYEKYHVNVVPYLESWNAKLSQDVKDKLMASDADILYNLKDLVTDDEKATEMTEQLENIGKYDLVSDQEAATSGLENTLKIKFEIDDFKQIEGKNLYIRTPEGDIKVPVTGQELQVQLPVGVYQVAPPKGNKAFDYENQYCMVADKGENVCTIKYNNIDAAWFGNEVQIRMRGYYNRDKNEYVNWDQTKIPVTLSTDGKTLHVDYLGTTTNSGGYSKEEDFAKVEVINREGEVVHSKSAEGGYGLFIGHLVDNNDVPVDIGYKVKIYYRSKNKADFHVESLLTGEDLTDEYVDFGDDATLTFVVTKYGLVPEELEGDDDELYEMYKQRVDKFAAQLSEVVSGADHLDPFQNPEKTNRLLSLTGQLKEEDAAAHRKFATIGEAPVISLADNGSYDYSFPAGTMSLEEFRAMVADSVTISDREEGEISFNSDYVTLDASEIDWGHAGDYTATLVVTDREGNRTTKTISVSITPVNQGDDSGNENGGSSESNGGNSGENSGSENDPSNPGNNSNSNSGGSNGSDVPGDSGNDPNNSSSSSSSGQNGTSSNHSSSSANSSGSSNSRSGASGANGIKSPDTAASGSSGNGYNGNSNSGGSPDQPESTSRSTSAVPYVVGVALISLAVVSIFLFSRRRR